MKSLLIIISLFLFLLPVNVWADLLDDINQQIQETENKRAELERKAKEYQGVINQKKGEIKTLSNQIAIFNARIGQLETEIEITEDDINQTRLEIMQLEYGIDQAQTDIGQKKGSLASIIRSIAEYDQASQLEIILQSDDLSDFFNQIGYLEYLQASVHVEVNKLKELKVALSQNKESKEEKKQKLESLKAQLDDQKDSLSGQKRSKEVLLTGTKGEETKYQQLLANIEAQKKNLLGDLNQLQQQKAAELARLRKEQETPPSQYHASLNWFFSQNDPRWARTTIGISNSQMADYGCAISSVAMVFAYHGTYITPGQLAKEPIFYSDLIVWPRQWGDIQLNTLTFKAAADWFQIDRELGAGNPVIVRIQADGKNGGHYVVVHHKTADGRYVVHDPFFGANIYLDSSRVYLGALYQTTTSINQMIIYHR